MIALMPKAKFEKPAGYKNVNASCMIEVVVVGKVAVTALRPSIVIPEAVVRAVHWRPFVWER